MARLSRRTVVAALGSAPLFAPGTFTAAATAAADSVLVLCGHYGELARRQERYPDEELRGELGAAS